MHTELKRRYWGRHFWSKGYCVSTIGLDEEQIREYVNTEGGGALCSGKRVGGDGGGECGGGGGGDGLGEECREAGGG